VSGQVSALSHTHTHTYQVPIMTDRHIISHHTSNMVYHVSQLIIIMSANTNCHM